MGILTNRNTIHYVVISITLLFLVRPVQAANIFMTADLAGTWEVNSLASGPGAPWWLRGAVTVNSNGSFSGTLDEYNSDPDMVSGTLSISADGVITSQDVDPDFRAAMDSGNTVIVGTATWDEGEPGTTYISVWVKKGELYPTKAQLWIPLMLLDD